MHFDLIVDIKMSAYNCIGSRFAHLSIEVLTVLLVLVTEGVN